MDELSHLDRPAAGRPGEPLIAVDRADPLPLTKSAPTGSRLLLGISLVLIALNLRPVFSSVSALLPEIMQSTGMQPGAASLMTTLPVLCLGLFAPFAPMLAARFGAERTILWLLALLAAATAMRGIGTLPALLAGATLAGAAIAVGNVLLPGLIKRDFPDRLALMTGLFTMALSAGAAAAAGLMVPLRMGLGGSWPAALAVWSVPVVLTFALWAWVGRGDLGTGRTTAFAGAATALRRSPLAWQITLFMGLQSAMAYSVFGYLAPILRERGLSAATAGVVVSWSIIVQCAACLIAPVLALRGRDQRLVNVCAFGIAIAGFIACVFAPLGWVVLWATAQGFGQGAAIALAMTAIVLRSSDARTAAALSGMAQSIGYTLASVGPFLFGLLREATGSYAAGVVLFTGFGIGGAACAYGAGRPRLIGDPAIRVPR